MAFCHHCRSRYCEAQDDKADYGHYYQGEAKPLSRCHKAQMGTATIVKTMPYTHGEGSTYCAAFHSGNQRLRIIGSRIGLNRQARINSFVTRATILQLGRQQDRSTRCAQQNNITMTARAVVLYRLVDRFLSFAVFAPINEYSKSRQN